MPTTRFAPSPTGFLHIGHALSALYTREQAGPGGRMLLRLEDIDQTRCRPEYAAAIEEDLAWLGLDWPRPVRVQSRHFADYAAVLAGLRARGLVYPCFCTRSTTQAEAAGAVAAPHGLGPVYAGTCRHLSASEQADRIAAGIPHALRLDVAKAQAETGPLTWRDLDRGTIAAAPERLGDVVLARKDCPTSYHLSVTWDDALQGVELVTRGEDLIEATHVHRLLQALLGLPVPVWRHHPLLLDAHGKRFAKRDKAPTLRAMREAGKTPAEVRALAGF
ncbi:tRNA glutamyl-Q(34) synthetase GluQRS [Aliidongia dinghuensis]|uniref:tRNA glutamyl-Q(34) synthetase GluQRS n=1 Tax=Aliidongia dinghuensis TaxID=1867774 RepID=A0A8J2YY44_9PROT|nr:tRNA glutamyl-Q(34) synthetase GluQRS [Aliidongia dinghuensis]GGF38777.1 tRNA glutamyl-Q(34) synthetase GluQRS [Aliidongia dinghuensis]